VTPRCTLRTLHSPPQALLSQLPPPGGLDAARSFARLEDVLRAAASSSSAPSPAAADWDAVPCAARPEAVLGDERSCGPAPAGATPAAHAARVARKRAQVDSFAAVLRRLLAATATPSPARPLHIVDFGCGSGGLTLPLAALFPGCAFVGVDMLAKSVELLRARALAARLSNVTGVVAMIERYHVRTDCTRRAAPAARVRLCQRCAR
jgi:SAM-dependent methyltransferase